MKNCNSNEGLNELSGIYSPMKRRFLSQPPESLSIGGRLRRERLLRKMTLEDMADYLGISSTYLGSIERGTRPLSRKLEKLLHDRLGVSYDFLLEGISVTGTMIAQYVRETDDYSITHKINVLLNVCTPEEQEDCYHLVHTYLSGRRSRRSNGVNAPKE